MLYTEYVIIYTQILEKELTASRGFVALLLFNLMKSPLQWLPRRITKLVQSQISFNRIMAFLQGPEISGLKGNQHCDICLPNSAVISFENVLLGWPNAELKEAVTPKSSTRVSNSMSSLYSWALPASREPPGARNGEVQMSDTAANRNEIHSPLTTGSTSSRSGATAAGTGAGIGAREIQQGGASAAADVEQGGASGVTPVIRANFTIPAGGLVAIVGSTGSGKSTLISGLLGECRCLEGGVHIAAGRSISIATQSAWIQNASLRDNVLFGADYDAERYKTVLRVCALDEDLKNLKDGDMTDIGEKGVNLSGGQQQRVSLARAAYSQSDIIILDDPLSAVDGKCTVHECHCSVDA